MKKLKTDTSKCNGCGICETVCSRTYFKEANREKSAIRIVKDGDTFKIEVCDQCGDCMKMCSPVALNRASSGVVRITKDTCVGCLVCVGECLKGLMRYHDDEPVPFKCVACGLCAKQCSTGALVLADV